MCHLDTDAKRCVEFDDHPPALQPGDIDRMFTRLTTQLDGVNTTEIPFCDHVTVNSGWWSCQAGRVEGEAVAHGTSSAHYTLR